MAATKSPSVFGASAQLQKVPVSLCPAAEKPKHVFLHIVMWTKVYHKDRLMALNFWKLKPHKFALHEPKAFLQITPVTQVWFPEQSKCKAPKNFLSAGSVSLKHPPRRASAYLQLILTVSH